MLRRVVEFESAQDASSLGGLEGLIEGSRLVRAQVVHDDANLRGLRIVVVDEILHAMSKSFFVPCGGRLRVISVVEDPPVIEKILRQLGLPHVPLPTAPARGQKAFAFEAA